MRYSDILRKGAYICGVFVCGLLIGEAALRLGGSIYGHIPRLKAVDTHDYTIVCCGDSFTYGWGVSRDKTYPARLEQLIKADPDIARKVSVVNLGVPGTNSSQVYNTIKGLFRQGIEPDMFIVLVGANDSWNFAQSSMLESKKIPVVRASLLKLKTFFADFRIYKLVQTVILNIRGRTFEAESDVFTQILNNGPADEKLVADTLRFNLERMIRLVKKEQRQIVLQGYPRGGPFARGFFRGIASAEGVIYVDHRPDFQKFVDAGNTAQVFLYDNSHPNTAGYEIMAENIYTAIKDRIENEKRNTGRRDN